MIRIFLTGYMGAGKTTLGKAFARKMNIPFIGLVYRRAFPQNGGRIIHRTG